MHAPVRPGSWAGRLNRANAKSIYLPVQGGKEARLRPTLWFGLFRFHNQGGLCESGWSENRLLGMKALVITSLAGPEALAVQDIPAPTLKAGQTLVQVSAGGLNFADFMTSKGGYPGT